MSKLQDEIRALMTAANMDQTAFAKAIGVGQPTVSRWLSGSEPERKHMRALRRFAAKRGLEFTPYGEEEEVPPVQTVPVIGYVIAGTETRFYSDVDGPLEYVPAPDGSTELTVAAEIRGDSLGPFFDTWRVFFDDIRRPVTSDLIGHVCVVGLADKRVLIKKIQKSGKRYHLFGQNNSDPILDVSLEWAAKVKDIRPRQ